MAQVIELVGDNGYVIARGDYTPSMAEFMLQEKARRGGRVMVRDVAVQQPRRTTGKAANRKSDQSKKRTASQQSTAPRVAAPVRDPYASTEQPLKLPPVRSADTGALIADTGSALMLPPPIREVPATPDQPLALPPTRQTQTAPAASAAPTASVAPVQDDSWAYGVAASPYEGSDLTRAMGNVISAADNWARSLNDYDPYVPVADQALPAIGQTATTPNDYIPYIPVSDPSVPAISPTPDDSWAYGVSAPPYEGSDLARVMNYARDLNDRMMDWSQNSVYNPPAPAAPNDSWAYGVAAPPYEGSALTRVMDYARSLNDRMMDWGHPYYNPEPNNIPPEYGLSPRDQSYTVKTYYDQYGTRYTYLVPSEPTR